MRRLHTLLRTRPALHPARALLTPAWLLALGVLALNDHLLKGAGVLPGVVTGKLSDFAGMVVAPVLLAALLRVRTRRGLLACHAAVGAVFAGINVSPAVADAWSWLMGFVWPWHITVDPTDLVALPALALGWRVLLPAMTRPLPVVSPLVPRIAEASAIAVGGFLCVATSEDEPNSAWDTEGDGDGELDYEDFDADVYLHNAAAHDIRVRTRPLRPGVQLDCLAVAEDPGLLLVEPLFGEGQTVTLPPSTNVGVHDVTEPGECFAVRVEGDALLAPFVLFWQASDVTISYIDGDIDDPAQHTDGAVLLAEDADLQVVVQESRSPIVFTADVPAPEDAFQPGSDAGRLAWTDAPTGERQLASVDVGPDGCVAVTVDEAYKRWYLCAPQGAFPFVAGQWVRIDEGYDTLEVVRIPDPQDPVEVPEVRLVLSRGAVLASVQDLVLAAKADYTAAFAPEPVCGTAARPDDVTARFAGGEVVHLRAGDTATMTTPDRALTLWVAHAEDRVILDSACAEGPDALGPDIEIAALVVASAP